MQLIIEMATKRSSHERIRTIKVSIPKSQRAVWSQQAQRKSEMYKYTKEKGWDKMRKPTILTGQLPPNEGSLIRVLSA